MKPFNTLIRFLVDNHASSASPMTANTGRTIQPDLAQAQRLETSYKNLERIAGWIGNADNKVLIVLAFQGAIIAGIATTGAGIWQTIQRQAQPWSHYGLAILFWVFVGCIILSLIYAFRAISPTVTHREHKEGRGSPFFYGTIAAMPLDQFRARMRGLDGDAIEEELIQQTHINAGIVCRKFQDTKAAIRFLWWELIFLLAAAVIVVLAPIR